MERKIGEIFEYNGEWYQCVNKGFSCADCDMNGDCSDACIGSCSSCLRKDGKQVRFKKLEKVGEPITVKGRTFQKLIVENYSCPNCVFYIQSKECYKNSYIDGPCYNNDIWVEIKQTKEDMEEKGQCGDNRFEIIDKAKEALLKETNIARDEQEMAVIDNILFRCWQMGWLDKYDDTKHSNSESIGKSLKPFSLEAEKSGKPVCTRDERKVRIICFDKQKDLYPIIALAKDNDGYETIYQYTKEGRSSLYGKSTDNDLMMLPKKKEGWVNVYKKEQNRYVKGLFPSREIALNFISEKSREYIATIKITWEE